MGRLFLFILVIAVICITIFMIIVNVKDQTCEIQQDTANFQQVVKSDVLIHHSNHLPTVVNSAVGVETKENSNRLPLLVCSQKLVYHTCCNLSNKKITSLVDFPGGDMVQAHFFRTTKYFYLNAFLYKCNKSKFNKNGRCHQIKQISIDKNILFFKTKRNH